MALRWCWAKLRTACLHVCSQCSRQQKKDMALQLRQKRHTEIVFWLCSSKFFAWWHCSRHIGRIPPNVAHSWPPWRVTNSVSHHQCCTRWHHSVLQLSHICLLSSWKYTGSFICGISETLPCCPKLTAANYLPASSQKCCLIGCDHRPARLNDLIISVTVCHLVTQLT